MQEKHRKLAALSACLAGILLTSCGAKGSPAVKENPAVSGSGIAARSMPSAPGTAAYKGVLYTASGTPEYMDILSPQPGKEPLPVILCVHGGAWTGGDRNEMNAAMAWLQGLGYCTCTIDYRLAPAAPFPAQIEDCKCAVRYLRAHAGELHIDPNRIGVFGISAGGHLALLLGLTAHVAKLEGTGGWNNESSKVQCVVDLCGPTDLANWPNYAGASPEVHAITEAFFGGNPETHHALAVEASPVTYVQKGEPPILMMHGDRDTLVPVSQSEELYSRLKADGNDVTLKIAKGVGHGSYDVFNSPENVALTQNFFARTLQKAK